MKYILVGTNRSNSNSRKIANIVQAMYKDLNETVEILDLKDFPFHELSGELYGKTLPNSASSWIQKINASEGLIVIVPEYNGSMPGVLKYFMDFWSYPDSFEHRPVCFVGLGGMFGGLRPVEHLQQVFGYRNSFIFPDRVFLMNVWKNIDTHGELTDKVALELLTSQTKGFQAFCRALHTEKLDAHHLILSRSKYSINSF
jgi:NAD(P)H-dependent FMN reductase